MKTNRLLFLLLAFSTAALASDDPTGLVLTSTSGSSANVALPQTGVPYVLESHSCGFHYRACTSSTCVSTQTDLFVPQDTPIDVPMKSDKTFIAAACDGTTSGTINLYLNSLP